MDQINFTITESEIITITTLAIEKGWIEPQLAVKTAHIVGPKRVIEALEAQPQRWRHR